MWVLTVAVAMAQPPEASTEWRPDWRKIGSSAVELLFAAPATGPVDRVWFSESGSTLFARTRSGNILQTADFETWVPVDIAPAQPQMFPAAASRLPEPGARVVAASQNADRMYALGRQLFRSDDGGRSWVNL